MKLKDCKHGVLVTTSEKDRIGMIVGITNNIPTASIAERKKIDRAVPLVQWSYGETSPIHQSNIEIYKGNL